MFPLFTYQEFPGVVQQRFGFRQKLVGSKGSQLEFRKNKTRSLALKELRTITKKSREPRSRAELEKKVVSHAMRHIAFLIQTGDQDDFDRTLTPETKKVFEKLWVTLAGKVF